VLRIKPRRKIFAAARCARIFSQQKTHPARVRFYFFVCSAPGNFFRGKTHRANETRFVFLRCVCAVNFCALRAVNFFRAAARSAKIFPP